MKEIIPENAQPDDVQIQFKGQGLSLTSQSISKKGYYIKKKISNPQRNWCSFFTNKFQKYLKTYKNTQKSKKIIAQLKAAMEAKKKPETMDQFEFEALNQLMALEGQQVKQKPQKYQKIQLEHKEIQPLLKDPEFKEVWIEFLKSGELQQYINKSKKVIPENKKAYKDLIPEIIEESKSENPFGNFLGAIYVETNNKQSNYDKCVNFQFSKISFSVFQIQGQMSINRSQYYV